ncbi:MAG: polysulfide reductase NrfD [Chromatiales bacterium]|jgi:molybdopterin-containing oxidoreductase family membrane subunit
MRDLFYLILDAFGEMLHGSRAYKTWVGFLLLLIAIGCWAYYQQLSQGLVVTNMTNQVSWGFYIANFTFLVGVAAAAVMLAVPAYIFHRDDIKYVVLMGDTMAITAVIMAILFVVVDLGRPDRFWHLLPGLGRFHFPESMLAWDVIVLTGYLLLNAGISFYIMFSHYRNRQPQLKFYFPFVLIAIIWAISIHTVTAFLFSANTGRPFWHTALLAPKFIASAFCSGPAVMLLGLQIIRGIGKMNILQSVINHLAIVMTLSLQITLFFLFAELFTDFYNESEHAVSARYLFFGLNGHAALTPWIWTAITLLGVATFIGTVHPLRKNMTLLNIAAVLTIIGVWIEKGMGFVVPGFIPTPIGEIYEYTPSAIEIAVSLGIWALGFLIFTLLAKAAIPIEYGVLRKPGSRRQAQPTPATANQEA